MSSSVKAAGSETPAGLVADETLALAANDL